MDECDDTRPVRAGRIEGLHAVGDGSPSAATFVPTRAHPERVSLIQNEER
ncbi:MAG: hypothetical protein GW913_04895 [Myxococcales bacterium]|nr:hypothetical protein [Myxococcales bacterium]